jgi:DNA-binding response OmpR family regulator
VPYAKHVFETFQDYAAERQIELHFLPNQPETIMDFDPDKMLRIFSNLLSNAIKYNRPGGKVYFQMDKLEIDGKYHFGMKVKDTGYGIPEEKLPHVFERFYRVEKDKNAPVKEGSGIGLSLTKELVEYFSGTITVRSTPDQGSTFTVLLPITQAAEVADPALFSERYPGSLSATSMLRKPSENLITGIPTSESEKPRVLVIEDNLDVGEYLRTCLEPYFQVSLAIDGEMGVDMAMEQLPDLIVSDVMMPKKDGFEVLSILKQDERTNHIPIIMLSAKNEVDARLEGLERGADAYLAKPFHQEELLLYIRNQLSIRKTLQERYLQQMQSIIPDQQTKLPPFLDKARQTMMDNLENENFGVEQLATELGISRSQLHNKLKQLTGESTTYFMNLIRVQEARSRLLKTDLPISEIAWSVGFKDPNYFTRQYKDFFKESPSQTRKSQAPLKQ